MRTRGFPDEDADGGMEDEGAKYESQGGRAFRLNPNAEVSIPTRKEKRGEEDAKEAKRRKQEDERSAKVAMGRRRIIGKIDRGCEDGNRAKYKLKVMGKDDVA